MFFKHCGNVNRNVKYGTVWVMKKQTWIGKGPGAVLQVRQPGFCELFHLHNLNYQIHSFNPLSSPNLSKEKKCRVGNIHNFKYF